MQEDSVGAASSGQSTPSTTGRILKIIFERRVVRFVGLTLIGYGVVMPILLAVGARTNSHPSAPITQPVQNIQTTKPANLNEPLRLAIQNNTGMTIGIRIPGALKDTPVPSMGLARPVIFNLANARNKEVLLVSIENGRRCKTPVLLTDTPAQGSMFMPIYFDWIQKCQVSK